MRQIWRRQISRETNNEQGKLFLCRHFFFLSNPVPVIFPLIVLSSHSFYLRISLHVFFFLNSLSLSHLVFFENIFILFLLLGLLVLLSLFVLHSFVFSIYVSLYCFYKSSILSYIFYLKHNFSYFPELPVHSFFFFF